MSGATDQLERHIPFEGPTTHYPKQEAVHVELTEEVLGNFKEDLDTYRRLAAQAKEIDDQLGRLKTRMRPIVEAQPDSTYKDGDGEVKIVHRRGSISFSGAGVKDLVEVWLTSDDPILKQCGQLINQHRSERSAYSYVQVTTKS